MNGDRTGDRRQMRSLIGLDSSLSGRVEWLRSSSEGNTSWWVVRVGKLMSMSDSGSWIIAWGL